MEQSKQTPFTLSGMCLASSAKYKEKTAFSMLRDNRICGKITYTMMGKLSLQIGSLLNQINVKSGDRVLIYCENCPEWPLAYFGISFAGAVSVPVLTGFSAEQIKNIAAHCGISAAIVSRALAEKFLQNDLSDIPAVIIDSMSEDKDSNLEISISLNGYEKRVCIPPVNEHSTCLCDDPDALATIIYTSGTQGNSKGVMLSGRNLISSALSSLFFIKLLPSDRLLSALPLSHSYECSLGLIAPLICGSSITYLDRPPSPSVLLPAFKILRPTVITTVPLLIEKIYSNAIAPKLQASRLYKLKVTRPLARWIAGRKLLSALGGKMRFFGIGGAPLSEEVEKFLNSIRFPYAHGYGLTEAAPLVAGNKLFKNTFRSVGSAPAGVKIRIGECESLFADGGYDPGEGEIQVTGPNVMMGYYNDEKLTAEAFTCDGWLRTGDLGWFDKKGKLHIRGRLKALILGPSGENIYPEEIENLLSASHLVEESLVYSGKKGEIVALVILSEAAKSAAGAVEHALEELRAFVNNKLAAFSRINKIIIKNDPFEKTPTMKIKRYLYV
ncbi:MAG: AMP-binding protein [Treponema sp.]|nr:AMP-binding protein [Treponema sp.]